MDGAGFLFCEPQPQRGQDGGCLLAQRLSVLAGAVHHDDKVIGVTDTPPVAQALLHAFLPLPPVRLPLPGEVLVQRRQRDVGQQRGEYPALGGAGQAFFPVADGRHDPGFEERLDQRAYPLVLDPCPEAVHEGDMPDFVEARPDVGLQYHRVAVTGVVVDLGYRVLRAAAWPEPVRARLEACLEDGFQDQLERRLDHPVGQGRYPEFTELAVLLRDHHLPDLRGPVFPGPQLSPDLGQEAAHAPGPALDMGSGHPVDAGRPRALIPPDAHPRFCQEVRVADEVEQVTEPAGRILSRPAVQLSLHTPYLPQHDQLVIRLPGLLIRPLGDGTGIPRRVFGHYSTSLLSFVTDWHTAALPHARGFPALGVLRRLRPARAFGRHRAYPAPCPWLGQDTGTATGGSHVHCCPVNGLGIRLCPCGIATVTPQHFHRGLPSQAAKTRTGVPRPRDEGNGCAPLTSPNPPG